MKAEDCPPDLMWMRESLKWPKTSTSSYMVAFIFELPTPWKHYNVWDPRSRCLTYFLYACQSTWLHLEMMATRYDISHPICWQRPNRVLHPIIPSLDFLEFSQSTYDMFTLSCHFLKNTAYTIKPCSCITETDFILCHNLLHIDHCKELLQ